MQLERKCTWDNKQYVCELTGLIDSLFKYPATINRIYKHYLYKVRNINHNCFVIRRPGLTVGVVEVDQNNKVIKCQIDKNCVDGVYYPEDINQQLQIYVGTILNYSEQ